MDSGPKDDSRAEEEPQLFPYDNTTPHNDLTDVYKAWGAGKLKMKPLAQAHERPIQEKDQGKNN